MIRQLGGNGVVGIGFVLVDNTSKVLGGEIDIEFKKILRWRLLRWCCETGPSFYRRI